MHFLKQLWARGVNRARDEYEETQSDIVHSSPLVKLGLYTVVLYVVTTIGLGVYWSFSPEALDVRAVVKARNMVTTQPADAQQASHMATTTTLVALVETLLNKPGGYLTNDIVPPGIWLDNMSNWEIGVLHQVRSTTQSLNSLLLQSGPFRQADVDLQKAEIRFNFTANSWMFPASESEYRSGIEHLQTFHCRLLQGSSVDVHLYVDAQHLNDYLAGVEQQLKFLSQRLTASIGPSINTDTSATSIELVDSKLTGGLYTKTSWFKLDDVFFHARGSSWALIALLQAIEIDFASVLESQHAKANFEQIIRELEPTQQRVVSPFIFNGEGFGFLANHSLVMASYLSRAQAAVADCRRQLLASNL
jgi:hypothetical protein